MRDARAQQWICRVCGYIYDPRLHEGVAFENLPGDWRCPGCGFGKDVFEPHGGPAKAPGPRQ